MGAGQAVDAHHIHILLYRSTGYLLRSQAQSEVNYLHPRITQATGNHLGPPVMPIEAWLGNQYPNLTQSQSPSSENVRLFVFPEDAPQDIAYFADGGVGFHRFYDEWHHIFIALTG